MPEQAYPGFAVQEDMRVKRMTWIGEVVEYVVLMTVIAMALLGLFGDGVLSKRQAQTPDGMTMQWQRYQRIGRPTTLELELPARDGIGRVAIDQSLLENWRIESIQPQPESTTSEGSAIRYSFRSEGDTADAIFELTPRKVGPRDVSVSTGAQSLTMNAFVYP